MITVAKFEKVSFEQYYKDCLICGIADDYKSQKNLSDDELKEMLKERWNDIKLPRRATSGSAGYDFHIPMSVCIDNEYTTIPTGIRCNIINGWVLCIVPRSGLGFKYRQNLANTVGVIDEDYYNANNEGHIMVRLASDKTFYLDEGERFVQGVFIPYGLTKDDEVIASRVGGFGSTGS